MAHARAPLRKQDHRLDARRLPPVAYAYLLGLYLGDGCLSRHPRDVYKLRISLDRRYPEIIDACAAPMASILPANRVRLRAHPGQRSTEVYSYSKRWPELFPQHGPGRKHLRKIVLSDWQRQITREHPEALLRGIMHSDGSRCVNRVRGPRRTYEYPRYFFSNRSEDIKAIFCAHCDLLGIEWAVSNYMQISVARSESVARLDQFIGPKS